MALVKVPSCALPLEKTKRMRGCRAVGAYQQSIKSVGSFCNSALDCLRVALSVPTL